MQSGQKKWKMSLYWLTTNFLLLERDEESGQLDGSYGRWWSDVGCHFSPIDCPSKFDVHCRMQRTGEHLFPKETVRLWENDAEKESKSLLPQ